MDFILQLTEVVEKCYKNGKGTDVYKFCSQTYKKIAKSPDLWQYWSGLGKYTVWSYDCIQLSQAVVNTTVNLQFP